MAIELSEDERLNRAVRALRSMIRDKRELNRLLLGKFETSDDECKQALSAALIDWNSCPPPLPIVDLSTHPNKHLLLCCAAVNVLIGAGLWHSREHMPSQDGGTSADDHAKAAEYSGWIGTFSQDYERKKSDQKLSMNISMALSGQGLPSEYGMNYGFGGERW